MAKFNLIPFGKQEGLKFEVLCEVSRKATDLLTAQFVINGDISQIKLDESIEPNNNELWRHTCFELFISSNLESYLEYNSAFDGRSNVYLFYAYRSREPAFNEKPQISQSVLSHTPLTLELEINYKLPEYKLLDYSKPLFVNPTLVLETQGISYWAAQHFADKADFHLKQNFCVSI